MLGLLFAQLTSDILGGAGRPLLPEALDPRRWERLRGDPFGAGRLAKLRSAADSVVQATLPALPFGSFMRFYRDGDRSEYEAAYFERRRRLNLLAIDLLAGGDPSRVAALDDLLWAICDEYSWCLPAHLPPPPAQYSIAAAGERGAAGEDEARLFVDLFAAETAFALAEITGLLGSRLSPEVLVRARREVEERVLSHFEDGGRHFWWEQANHNWAAVCAGAVCGAALWMLDADRTLGILRRLGPAFDCYLAGFPADGACLEGLGYWTYGFGYFLSFAELLRERSSGRIDLLGLPELREPLEKIAGFPERAHLSGAVGLSFSDALRPYRYPLGFLSRLAERYPEVELPPLDVAEELSYDPCARWAKALRDFAWARPWAAIGAETASASAAASGTRWFPNAQWAIYRGHTSGPFFAAKGGSNDEPHNHNDCGSFILGRDGELLLEDLGAPRYERDYFGPRRYEYFVASSLGHSLPILAGRGQSAGSAFRCTAASFEGRGAGLHVSYEIGAAYALPWLEGLRRELEFDPDGSPVLRLLDAFRLDRARDRSLVELRERFVCLLRTEKAGPGRVVVRGSGMNLQIVAATDPAQISIETRHFEPSAGGTREVTVIDFVYEVESSSFSLDFAFSFC